MFGPPTDPPPRTGVGQIDRLYIALLFDNLISSGERSRDER
jgi:hypothetical protein